MTIVLLVLIGVVVVASVGLCAEMYRRGESLLGATAVVLLMGAGVLATVYAAMAAE